MSALFSTLTVLGACSDDPAPGPTDSGPRRDGSAQDALPAHDDAEPRADAEPSTDAEPVDAGPGRDAEPGADAVVRTDERGFPIRVPQRRTVPCMGRGGSMDGCPSAMVEAEDVDFVCTLRHGTRDRHFIYVQSRPIRLDPGLGLFPLPIFTRDGSWLSDGMMIVGQDFGAIYDYGGGHHNDSLTVDLTDVVYRYYHSSFGFGFRRCQEMDCISAYPPGSNTPTSDGCTRDRTLPVVCVRVAADGTVPPLTDTFMRCPGDT